MEIPKCRLIGVMGLMGAGKDTSSDYLCNKCGFRKRALAKPLKDICEKLFLFDEDQLYGKFKETPDLRWYGVTPRKTMQYVGTNLLRNRLNKIMPGLNKDIFIHNFELWYHSQEDKIIVPDVRFQNEVDLIHKLGGKVIKVIRSPEDDEEISLSNRILNFLKLSKNKKHVSEREQRSIKNYDYLIYNTSSIENLHSELDALIQVLKLEEL